MRERIGLMRCWSANAPDDEKDWMKKRADEEFDWHCEQVKLAGIAVSPIRRSERTETSEDGLVSMTYYYVRAEIEGTKAAMPYMKGVLDRKLPPVVECRHVEWKGYSMYVQEGTRQLLVHCCFCSGAFTIKTLWYQNTRLFRIEANCFCPHCHTRIVEGRELEVIPTDEEMAKRFEAERLVKEQA